MMNSKLRTVLVLLVLALLLSGGLVYQRVQAQQPQQAGTETSRTVSVIGFGQASAEPDVAVVTLGVRTDAATAQEALTQNNEKMEQLLTALGDAGIAEEDIQTISVQLQPRFEEPQDQQETTPGIAGYTAANIVEVRVRDTDQLGEIIDSAVSAGGNTVEGIRFEIESGRADLYNQALEAAMDDARVKAEQLASLANAELGDVLMISEGSSFPIPLGAGGAVREAAVPIEPGMQAITANVQVTFLLVPSGTVLPGTGQTPTAAVTRTVTPTAAVTRTATRSVTATRAATSTSAATATTAAATSTERATATTDATSTTGATTTEEATSTESAATTEAATTTVDVTATQTP